jgi:hypothetical protein
MKDLREHAVMNIDEGEEIAGMWITPLIPGTGQYNLLARKKKDGIFEWAQLIQRESGEKQLIFRGSVKTKKELEQVLILSNNMLHKIFGDKINLEKANYNTYTVGGSKGDSTIH